MALSKLEIQHEIANHIEKIDEVIDLLNADVNVETGEKENEYSDQEETKMLEECQNLIVESENEDFDVESFEAETKKLQNAINESIANCSKKLEEIMKEIKRAESELVANYAKINRTLEAIQYENDIIENTIGTSELRKPKGPNLI